MKHLIAILFTACALAQTGSWPTPATDQDLVVAKTGATSTLSAGINASTLTVVVADGSKFAQYSVIRIDDEYMQICSIATNTLTICNGTRGLVGSAASHLAGVTVRDVVSEYHHNRLRVEIKAMQTKLLPATSGTTAPATCAANRELFVDRDATPAPTLSICDAAGTGWTVIAGGGAGDDLGSAVAADVVALFSGSGDYLKTDGTQGTPEAITVGPSGMLTKAGGVIDGDTAVLCRKGDTCAPTGAQDHSGAATTKPAKHAASDPATCSVGEKYYNTTDNEFRNCTAVNTWTDEAAAGVGTGDVTSNTATSVDGEIALFNSTSGKQIKRSALTGVLKSASGVASVVTGTATDCVLVDGTSAACGSGAGNVSTVATLTSGLPVIGAGTTAVGIGSRTGNTTEYVTQSGAKTAGKQVTYDASGNAIASAYDVGAAGSGDRTVLHHEYNQVVAGNGAASQVWATYTIAGGTLQAGDLVEVRAHIRKTAGTDNDRNIAVYFGNGNAPAYGMVLETGKQYTYWHDWLITSSSTAVAVGFKGSPSGATNVGAQADHAIDASSLNLANDIIVKLMTTSAQVLDNTNSLTIVQFTVTHWRP